MWRSIRGLVKGDAGAVAVYLALATAFLLPITAIAIDLSRYYGLNTELQQAAESAALAGAKELNSTDAGLVAAEAAARTSVTNTQAFATDTADANVQLATVQFLTTLPPAGQTNYDAYVTVKGSDARYINVITEVREIESAVARAYFGIWGGNSDPNASKKWTQGIAVAAKTTVACRAMPMMTCNPAEELNAITTSDYPNICGAPEGAGGPNTFLNFDDFLRCYPEWTRRQVRVKFIGPGAGYEAGVFGLLEPMFSSKKGAGAIEDEMALETPTSCLSLDGAKPDPDIKPGQAQTIVDGINVRFDMYQGNWNKEKNNPDYPPAKSVVKGRLPDTPGKVCNPDPVLPGDPFAATVQKLPQDECYVESDPLLLAGYMPECYPLGLQDGGALTGGGNKGYSGRIGNGRYDIVHYFEVNHPGAVDTVTDPTGPIIDGAVWAEILAIEAFELAEAGYPIPTGDALLSQVAKNAPDGDATQVPPSRDSIYRWELNADPFAVPDVPGNLGKVPGVATTDGTTPTEEGTPQCAGPGAASANPDRRSLFIAVVNCKEFADEIAAKGFVPVREFMEVFVTEPADHDGKGGSGDKGAIYLEFKRVLPVGAINSVVLRDIIQLY